MVAQTLVIVALCAACGVYFSPKVGIADLFHQLWIGTIAGVVCALIWIVSYYGFIRSRMDQEDVFITEQLRMELGLATRITSGGITEVVALKYVQ